MNDEEQLFSNLYKQKILALLLRIYFDNGERKNPNVKMRGFKADLLLKEGIRKTPEQKTLKTILRGAWVA